MTELFLCLTFYDIEELYISKFVELGSFYSLHMFEKKRNLTFFSFSLFPGLLWHISMFELPIERIPMHFLSLLSLHWTPSMFLIIQISYIRILSINTILKIEIVISRNNLFIDSLWKLSFWFSLFFQLILQIKIILI